MESISARDLDRRLADLVRSERNLVVQFVVELAGFAKRELYRELGYTSLFYYCVRQLGLSKSSAFRRSETARLIARFPVIAEQLADSRLSIRALVELREVPRRGLRTGRARGLQAGSRARSQAQGTDRSAARTAGNFRRKRSLRPRRGQVRGLGARPRALYLAHGRWRSVRLDAPARIRPRSRGGSRRQGHHRKHPAALQEPQSD